MFKKNLILFTLFVFVGFSGYSQVKTPLPYLDIETSIRNKTNLIDAGRSASELKQLAEKEGNEVVKARMHFYEMLIKDLRTEDTLYFKNSAFLDSIITEPASSGKIRSIMHLLQAKRLTIFYYKTYREYARSKYEIKGQSINYAALEQIQHDSIIDYHFQEALRNAPSLDEDKNDLMWLTSFSDVFLLKPRFSDIIMAEKVGYALVKGRSNEEHWLEKSRELLALNPDKFLITLHEESKKTDTRSAVLRDYYQWMILNKAIPENSAFLETLVRKYIFLQNSADTIVNNTYQTYLRTATSSPFDMVKAHSVYQLCLILQTEGSKYFDQDFNPDLKLKNTEALQLYSNNRRLLSNFPSLEPTLITLEKELTKAVVDIKMEDVQLPDKPILLHTKYKNLRKIYYRIVRSAAVPDRRLSQHLILKKILAYAPVKTDSLIVPQTNDYNFHGAYTKINGLPAGPYYLLFSDTEINDASGNLDFIDFRVTNLAVLNTSERVFVLDRQTGKPVEGAEITGDFRSKTAQKDTTKKPDIRTFRTNNEGYAIIKEEPADDLTIALKADTLKYEMNSSSDDKPDDVYSKEEYDDLVEYHDENAKLWIYTDRSIYRPGQTVFFKAILLSKNPKTGETIIYNKQNVKGSMFNNVYKKWLSDAETVLYLKDAHNRKIDSLKLVPDDYGSFSGSFKIPKSASTGEWDIESDLEIDYRSDGSFEVEEYKRPTFEMTIEKPKKMLIPGAPVTVTIKVKSFSGAQLNNLPVKLQVHRSGSLQKRVSFPAVYLSAKLVDTIVNTNNEGIATLEVRDTALYTLKFGSASFWHMNYSMEASVTDNTGETQHASDNITFSSRPVNVTVKNQSVYDRQFFTDAAVNTSNELEGNVNAEVKIKIYKTTAATEYNSLFSGLKTDQWIYSKEELQQIRPDINFGNRAVPEVKSLVFETTVNTGKSEKLHFPKDKLPTGKYELVAEAFKDGQVLGSVVHNFKVFDSQDYSVPAPATGFSYLPINTSAPGQTVKYHSGAQAETYNIYHVRYKAASKNGTVYKDVYINGHQQKGLQQQDFTVPNDAIEQLLITKIYVLDNAVYKKEERIYLPENAEPDPEIITEVYRKIIAPGAKEIFKVKVKTKNLNKATQLMSVIYDASLDKLEPHKWELPDKDRADYLDTKWPYSINSLQNSFNYITKLIRNTQGFYDTDSGGSSVSQALQGRASGVSISYNPNQSLQEMVVVGYGISKNNGVPGSAVSVQIRGLNSSPELANTLIVIDGVVYNGDLKSINSSSIFQAVVLKGADATAIYGSRAANGVVIISTSGPVVIPEIKPEPVVKVRKDFKETAFFSPKLYADADGFYTMEFTMPESVTEWNWKMLAHTKDSRFAYAERKLYTQLSLMVQPNMPRLLYQGDKINLRSRISNLDTTKATGNISCTIEDAVTGTDLTAAMLAINKNSFSLDSKLSMASGFMLTVPADQTNPLKITIKVSSGSFADAEEHIIPVYSTRVFIRQSVPFAFNSSKTEVTSASLPADAQPYGMSISINPKPQAALINSLPWLANYSFNCAEQTFNKLFAHITALQIMKTDPLAQSAFAKAKSEKEKAPEKTGQLPNELPETELPWLNLSSKTDKQQAQLFQLLDTLATKAKIKSHLERLYKLQNADGGLAWFDGGKSNAYISDYVLAGFGKLLKNNNWLREPSLSNRHDQFLKNLISYTDTQLMEAFKLSGSSPALFSVYARILWSNAYPLRDEQKSEIKKLLVNKWIAVNTSSLTEQALLITTTFKYYRPADLLYVRANQQLESIRQLAIEDEQNGMRWKDFSDTDGMNTSAEESVALLADAFETDGSNQLVTSGILKWLLNAKSDYSWRTTKGTAAAIELLKKDKQTIMSPPQTLNAAVKNKVLSVSDDMLSGNPYSFVNSTDAASSVTINRTGNSSVSGAVTWYYFTSSPKIDSLNRQVVITKTLFTQDKATGWKLYKGVSVLKPGDKVKVLLTIHSDKPLQYVYLDDKRPAAFEPVETSSGYAYGSGFGYYRSVRDTGLQLFAEAIPSGDSEMSYELIVAQEGTFFSGPAMLQCMYQPGITAYSNTGTIKVE